MMSRDNFSGPVNLGNPCEFTVRELAEKILGMTGSKSLLLEKPLPDDDPRQRRPDITLAQQELGWTPKVTLEDGLLQTIRYFDELLSSDSRQAQQGTLKFLRRSTDKPKIQAGNG